MYTDTKNLAAINNSSMQQKAPTDTSGREKSYGRMSKMWKPILRLLTRKRTTQPRKFHPNNVDLNNTAQYHVTKEDSANIHKQQDICTEFIAKQMANAETRLAYQQQRLTTTTPAVTTTTPVISSVYVDKATTPTTISTPAIACTGCIYGRNCQQVHSASEQEQLSLLNLLNQSDAEISTISLSAQLDYLSTDQGLLYFPDDDNSNSNSTEHDQLLYALLYQRFALDALPVGTLC